MIHRAALGVFQPADFHDPWNPIRGGIGDLVRARFDNSPTLPGRSGLSGLGCPCNNRGVGTFSVASVESDFNAMVAGTAPWSTYALYGGIVIGGVFVMSMFSGGGGGGRRRRR